MSAFYDAPDGQQAQGVIIVNATSSPIPTAPTVAMGSGPIDANTQRVTLATDDPGVAALASIDAKTPALVSSAQPVIATARTCLGTFRLSVTSTAATLPALIMAVGGAGIPAGSVVCELQADGGTVRLSRFDSVPADLATGKVALRDVSTGALLGATMTMGQLFTGVASLIREKELAAESAAQAPAA